MNNKQKKPVAVKKQLRRSNLAEKLEVVIFPKSSRPAQHLARDVQPLREEKQRFFVNLEDAFAERAKRAPETHDRILFEQLHALIEQKQHHSQAEIRQLRESIHQLLHALDEHLSGWSKGVLERIQQHADQAQEKWRKSMEELWAEHGRNLLDSVRTFHEQSQRSDAEYANWRQEMQAFLEERDQRLTAWLEEFKQELPEQISQAIEYTTAMRAAEEAEADDSRTPFFKLGDPIQVYVGDVAQGGPGSFISMNDEVLVWYDATGRVCYQGLQDDEVSVRRV